MKGLPATKAFVAKQQRHRDSQRQTLRARVVVPLNQAQRAYDPLQKRSLSLGQRLAYFAGLLMVAIGIHVSVVVVGQWFRPMQGRGSEQIAIEVIERPVEKPPEPPKQEGDVPKAEPKAAPKPVAAPLPPPPTASEPPPSPQKPVRVVGLSLDSTAAGGGGPSFAVGNTREGRTDTTATDPDAIPKGNQVATRIPVAGVPIIPPSRKRPQPPPYPALLREQGIEANVVVVVSIDTTGKVVSVNIAKSSGYPEFDEAARAAAFAEEFTPATRGGEPVAYSWKYTYLFRLSDS